MTTFANCPSCGYSISEGSRFCPSCGCDFYPKCSTCGKEFPCGTKFCDIDGTPISKSQSTPPPFAPPPQPNYAQNSQNTTSSNPQRGLNGYIYPKASIISRLLALILDNLFSALIGIPAIIFLGTAIAKGYTSFQSYGVPKDMIFLVVMAIIFSVFPLIYGVIKDGLGSGQSVGKKAMGLMVVKVETNTPCSKGRSAIRFLCVMLLCIVPYLGWLVLIIDELMPLFAEDGRRLIDKMAGTQVIEKRHYNPNV